MYTLIAGVIAKYGMAAILVGVIAGGAYLWVEDVKDDACAELQANLDKVQLEYEAKLARTEQAISDKYAEKHIARVEKIADERVKFQRETLIGVTTAQIEKRAATAEGREDLNARAEERTNQLFTKMEELSNWNELYDTRDTGTRTR